MMCYQQKSPFLSLLACRIVKITLQHGMHEKSAFGFACFALAYATVFKDNISQAYKLGKYALAITTNKNMPEVYCTVYGMVCVWKEPMQAILPELKHAYKVGMESQVRKPVLVAISCTFMIQACLTKIRNSQ